MKRKIIWWTLTAAWCVFIFYHSAKPADSSNIESGFIVDMLNHAVDFIFGKGHLAVTQHFVRKAAHLTEYAILGCLIYNSLQAAKSRLNILVKTVLLGTVYAATDEIHQFFIPGRAMMLSDVAIDAAGIILGSIFTIIIISISRPAGTTPT